MWDDTNVFDSLARRSGARRARADGADAARARSRQTLNDGDARERS